MAPEVMAEMEFDFKADVYSFGVILWQLLTLEDPFQGFDDWDEFYDAVCNKNLRPTIPDECIPSLRSLIRDCWSSDKSQRPSFTALVSRLESVILDLSIEDHVHASAFWEKYFLRPKNQLQEEIDWKDFTAALAQETGQDRVKFELLKPYLGIQSGADWKVIIRQFNYSVRWFDYFFVRPLAAKTLETIRTLLSKPWFHGMIDQKESDGRLSTTPQGTFLVRLSTTMPEFPFTLSLPQQRHVRLRKERGQNGIPVFTVSNVTTTWPDLLSMIEGIRVPLGLVKPCPKTPAKDAYTTL